MAGISGTADEEGFLQYQRPEGKSGGHGVGWSEIPRYKFRVPAGWEETPVSIADLGGTEVCPSIPALCPVQLLMRLLHVLYSLSYAAEESVVY